MILVLELRACGTVKTTDQFYTPEFGDSEPSVIGLAPNYGRSHSFLAFAVKTRIYIWRVLISHGSKNKRRGFVLISFFSFSMKYNYLFILLLLLICIFFINPILFVWTLHRVWINRGMYDDLLSYYYHLSANDIFCPSFSYAFFHPWSRSMTFP